MKWVSVEKKLPKEHELVLCYCKGKCRNGSTFICGMQSKGFWFFTTDVGILGFTSSLFDVTHWCEIPEAPKDCEK